MHRSRRALLSSFAAATAAGLAGCPGLTDADSPEPGGVTPSETADGGSTFRRVTSDATLAAPGDAGGGFGKAVALSDRRGFVAAPSAAGATDHSGTGTLFDRDSWSRAATVEPRAAGAAAALSDGTALVGAPHATDESGVETGAAFVFERADDGWERTATLTAAEGADSDEFGRAVALAGDTAVVGAPENGRRGEESGAAYVFERAEGEWRETATLAHGDPAPGDRFGDAVATDGDTVAVGGADDDTGPGTPATAPATDALTEMVGSVTVFERADGGWERRARLTATDGREDDGLGWSVAVDDGTVLAGAVFRDSYDEMWTGGAYVFGRDGDGWEQAATLTASDGDDGDEFGASVALAGDRAVVGAPSDEDPYGERAGSAYAFARSDGEWTETAKLVAEDGTVGDSFGFSVALTGATALVGAPNSGSPNDDDDGGSVSVFELDAGE
ncbi:PKD domain-containing protein [Halosimplex carlsbadense 2-9-1]|uniref:PKD domain-containing protein n=1 Tax=Halosimplex carlsbadense 2-9-1 TaxID=797114 RepID=M0D666_9EURY|nr:FG-GAP repeat protein [Halosimplex carlsbadense]ELZ29639.1 PKD domain-containing protein [Halosimplex carlsbadense 2-9-1]